MIQPIFRHALSEKVILAYNGGGYVRLPACQCQLFLSGAGSPNDFLEGDAIPMRSMQMSPLFRSLPPRRLWLTCSIVMTGVAGAMLGGTPTAHAQILTNGGFEQPSAVFQEIPAGDPSLTGWTVVNGSVEVIGNSIWDSFEGSQSIDLDGISAGTIEQTFATTPGTTYSLSFAYGNNPFGGATIPAFANVSVTGTATLLNNFFSHSSSDPFGSPMNYNTFFDTFVADSSLTTLRFTSLDAAGSNGGIALDAVSVQVATAAPEPGSIALAACSALPLAGMVIRRRRRSA